MLNSIYRNPTVIYFGKGMISRAGEEVSWHTRKALLLFGGGSCKKYGLHTKIMELLKASGLGGCLQVRTEVSAVIDKNPIYAYRPDKR